MNTAKLVTKAHLPSKIRDNTHEILSTDEVNGAATLASACDNETPTCAAFNACNNVFVKLTQINKCAKVKTIHTPQSLAPSPTIDTT